jgi:hypothetical protein
MGRPPIALGIGRNPTVHRRGYMVLAAATVAALVAAGAAAPAPALKQGAYEGKVKGAPGSEITFRVDRRKGDEHVKVYRFTATNVPTKCGGAPDTTEYGLAGYFGLRLRSGKFHAKDSPSGFRDDSLFVVHGKVGAGGRAHGTLQIVDDFDNLPTCDTGVVDWSASR